MSQCPSWSSLPEGINIWNMWNRSHCGLPGFGCRDPRWHVHVSIPGTFPGVETEIEFCDWKMVQRCLTSRTRCLHRSLQRTKVTTTVFVEPSSFSVSNLDGENGCRQGGKAKISSHIVLTFSSLHQWKHRKFGQKVWTAPSNIYIYIYLIYNLSLDLICINGYVVTMPRVQLYVLFLRNWLCICAYRWDMMRPHHKIWQTIHSRHGRHGSLGSASPHALSCSFGSLAAVHTFDMTLRSTCSRCKWTVQDSHGSLKFIEVHWNWLLFIYVHWCSLKCFEVHLNSLMFIVRTHIRPDFADVGRSVRSNGIW